MVPASDLQDMRCELTIFFRSEQVTVTLSGTPEGHPRE